MWIPCGPKQVQTSMQELASKGLASKVFNVLVVFDGSTTVPSVIIFFKDNWRSSVVMSLD